MGSKTDSLEVATLMEGSPGDVTVSKRQSEQRLDGKNGEVFKRIIGLIQVQAYIKHRCKQISLTCRPS